MAKYKVTATFVIDDVKKAERQLGDDYVLNTISTFLKALEVEEAQVMLEDVDG